MHPPFKKSGYGPGSMAHMPMGLHDCNEVRVYFRISLKRGWANMWQGISKGYMYIMNSLIG